jgi:CheY-like chemotaxis protein
MQVPLVNTDDLRGLRVLLVEDDADARDLFGLLLEHRGAQVRRASCAADALDALRRDDFDLLVSDVRMPGQDGCELVRKLRAFDARLPALAVSGSSSEADRQRALDAGFDAHLAKPVSAAALAGAVVEVCRLGASC